MSEIEREADLADRLASRILESAERGTLSSDELWENPDASREALARGWGGVPASNLPTCGPAHQLLPLERE